MIFTISSQLYCSACGNQYIRYSSSVFLCYTSGVCAYNLMSLLCINANCSAAPAIFSNVNLQQLTFNNNGVCAKSCQGGYVAQLTESVCSACTGLVFYSPDSNGNVQCVAIASRDLAKCPYYLADTLQCVATCPQGYLTSGTVCVQSCPTTA
jgi:hypothetical protein